MTDPIGRWSNSHPAIAHRSQIASGGLQDWMIELTRRVFQRRRNVLSLEIRVIREDPGALDA